LKRAGDEREPPRETKLNPRGFMGIPPKCGGITYEEW
jgi:hypothetical protein